MSAAPSLRRRPRRAGLISLVPMVDVLMIFLVFFMVTSRFVDLDMIPLAAADKPGNSAPETASGTPLLLRLSGSGEIIFRSRVLTPQTLQELVGTHVADSEAGPVLILPSPYASTQALVTTMDLATQAGAAQLQLVRLEGRQ